MSTVLAWLVQRHGQDCLGERRVGKLLTRCSVAAASRVKWSVAFAKRSLDALGEDSTYEAVVAPFAATLALEGRMVAVWQPP